MNVLSINYRSNGGGAATVAKGLFKALPSLGHTSRMLTGFPSTPEPDIASIALSWPGRIPYHALNLAGLNYLGIPGQRRLLAHPFVAEADVLHLHNLHGGYFNYRWLPSLTALKPVVWTLHDMWPLTGHCSHSFECRRWTTGCGACPYPKIYPPIRRDATHLEWRLKHRLYAHSTALIVTPSRWLAGLVGESMLGHLPVQVVPNAVDTALYAPQSVESCRNALGLPTDKVILLFVAEHVDSPFKRFDFRPRVFQMLSENIRRQLLLLVMGADAPQQNTIGGIPAVYTGFIADDHRKAQIFNAADALLYPTRADNCPMVIQEALSCGCPTVAEDVGGVGELVRDNDTGLLVPSDDPAVFSSRLEALVTRPDLRKALSDRCRAVAVTDYSQSAFVQRMLACYQEAIENWRRIHGTTGK